MKQKVDWAHLVAYDKSIIAASPELQNSPSEMPYRIVLRHVTKHDGAEFIVHTEVLQDGKPYYTSGSYFPFKDNANEALKDAWACFDRRVRQQFGMPDLKQKLKEVADIAESIISQLLELAGVDGEDELRDELTNDYMLESNLETFENLTGKKIRPEPVEEEEEEEVEEEVE
jgi:hypothetical protein